MGMKASDLLNIRCTYMWVYIETSVEREFRAVSRDVRERPLSSIVLFIGGNEQLYLLVICTSLRVLGLF